MLASVAALCISGASGFVASPSPVPARAVRAAAPVMAAAEGEFVPDLQRRTIMNLVLPAVPVGWLAGGFILFFVPPGGGGGGAGLQAKDALGNSVKGADWAKKHPFPDRALVEG